MSAQRQSEPARDELRPAEALALLRRRWLGIVGWSCAAALGGLGFALLSAPEFRARARLLVEVPEAGFDLGQGLAQLPTVLPGLSGASPPVLSEIEFLRSRPLAETVLFPDGGPAGKPLVRVDDLSRTPVGTDLWRRLRGLPEARGALEVEVESWESPDDESATLLVTALPGGEVEFARECWWGAARERSRFEAGQPLSYGSARLRLRPTEELTGRTFRLRRQEPRRALEDFQERLQVEERPRGSSVVDVTLSDSDPERAARVVNRLVEVYLGQNRARQLQRAGRSAELLQQEVERVRAELAEAESRLLEFGQRAGPMALPASAAELVKRMADVDLERAKLSFQARSTEELLRRIAAGELSAEEVAALEARALGSARAPTGEGSLAALLARRAALVTAYNEDWPELAALKAEIETRVAGVRARLAAEFANDTRLAADLEAISTRYQGELAQLPEAQVELARHQRSIDAYSQILLFMVGKLQESSFVQNAAAPSVEVIEWAVPPRLRETPKLRVAVGLGLLLGLLLGVSSAALRELRRPIGTGEHLADLAGAPLLAELPARHGARHEPALRDLSQALAGRLGARSRLALIGMGPESRAPFAELARACARRGRRVALVQLGPAAGSGPRLADVLAGKPWSARPAEGVAFTLLTGGEPEGGAAEADWSRLLEALGAEHDWVLLGANLEPGSDALALAVRAGGAVLLCPRDQLAERVAQRRIEELRLAGVEILGVVLLC